ncbi:uncharacterized protein LOC111316024 [Durio zibethinus]|uniref:Uncharacterized protein LOC111316024 n=1 Tax=Durio zibethinus TaxID=66656 RepID=A0A6P6BA23_DURZI|nr:uncharacterized protein LOC111316024 [Durio zibethinus]
MFFIPALPFIDSAIDFATISFIAILLFLSLFSICFIFHLRFKSRRCRHLQNFNSLWTFRFLFVFFITSWALTELLRLPYFRRSYFYPLLPQLTLPQRANLCKVHLVLSLGFFEPGFLVTLLFLLEVSVKKTHPRSFFSVFFVLDSCLPIFLLQVYFVFFQGREIRLPELFHRSWFLCWNSHDHNTVLCAYPLLSTILFGVFGAVFTLSFLFSFWRVVSHVINKALRVRIFALALAVIIGLPLQILFMGLSVFWTPDKTAFDGIALIVFLTTFTCAVVGEGILVIKPIADSLAARGGEGGESCRVNSHGEMSSLPGSMQEGNVV